LIEGIMMRGPQKQAIVVRRQDGGLEIKVEELQLVKEKHKILGWPFIRGVVNFLDSMVKGVKALMYSASFFPEDEGGDSAFDKWVEKHFSEEKAEKIILWAAVVFGIAVSVALFILLPTLLAGVFSRFVGNSILRNLLEGCLRIAIFLCYLALTSKLKDIQRVWQYHGAEHKTIHCYEKGLELTPANAAKQSCLHPRCGTSFLFIVMLVSILVFSFVHWSNALIRMALRLALLPVVVGISYEIIKLAGRHDNWLTRLISAPGKALQKFTTREPDETMLEVAIEALKQVLPEETGADRW